MERRRRSALIALATVDVVVLGLVGYLFIVRDTAGHEPVPQVTGCTQSVLASLPSHLSPAVAWETDSLTIRLAAYYDLPSPPESNAQLIWNALDSIRRASEIGCTLPAEITLLVSGYGKALSENHHARLAGSDVKSWVDNVISEAELGLRGKYWKTSESPPVTSSP